MVQVDQIDRATLLDKDHSMLHDCIKQRPRDQLRRFSQKSLFLNDYHFKLYQYEN